MWFQPPRRRVDWSEALLHLRGADPGLAGLIDRVGPCLLRPRRDYFVALCQAIFTQQVSMAVAATLFKRFRALFPQGRPTPQRVLAADEGTLKSIGLSRQKLAYLRDLAAHFAAGRIPTRKFARMSDEQIIESLTAVHGIGHWTAEMFLIFVLNRPDVLPVDDLGIRKGMQRHWSLDRLPDADTMIALAAPWRPWRTIATWYLWRAG